MTKFRFDVILKEILELKLKPKQTQQIKLKIQKLQQELEEIKSNNNNE